MRGVYRDRFLFANKTALELLEYSLEELKQLHLLDVVYDKGKSLVKRRIEKRLRGYHQPFLYPDLRLKTKRSRILNFNLLTQTIVYNGGYAGLMIGLDVTKQKKLEKFYIILKTINELIIRTLSEEELWKSICQNLVELFDLKLVWVSRIKPKDEGKGLTILHSYGEEKTFLERFLYPYLMREHEPLFLAILP